MSLLVSLENFDNFCGMRDVIAKDLPASLADRMRDLDERKDLEPLLRLMKICLVCGETAAAKNEARSTTVGYNYSCSFVSIRG
jgi:hypothetical protein